MPAATWAALFQLLPAVAVFWIALSLSSERLRSLSVLLLGLACIESLLALIQYVAEPTGAWRGANADSLSAGSYANRHHLAAFLLAALPLALALLTATLGREKNRSRHRSAMHGAIAAWLSRHTDRTAIRRHYAADRFWFND